MHRLTVMMSKLAANNDGTNKQFKPKIFQGKRRGQKEVFMTNIIMIKEVIKRYTSSGGNRRIAFNGRIQYGQNYRDRPRYEQSYRKKNNRCGYMSWYALGVTFSHHVSMVSVIALVDMLCARNCHSNARLYACGFCANKA